MKQHLLNAMKQESIICSVSYFESIIVDFTLYCEEMEFTSEEEIASGAVEYILVQLHSGLIK